MGTDAPEIVELLDPWQIDDFDQSQIELVDYGVRLHDPATGSKNSKPLHRLARGSCTLITSRDPQRINQALLRALATHGGTIRPGTMRIEMTPLLRDGEAVLVPLVSVLPMSERWLASRGVTRVDAVSSVLDPEAIAVELDHPLGSHDARASVPLTRWFLPFAGTCDDDFTPGQAVAQAMGLMLDVSAENAATHLEQLVHCVKQLPPRVAPEKLAGWSETLKQAFAR